MRPSFVLSLALLAACQTSVPLGASCDRNSACPAPLVCRFGRCRNECVEQRDCPIGTTCLLDENGLGSCNLPDDPDCNAAGASCAAPLACVGRACVNVCVVGVECPSGSECVPVGDGRARCVRVDGADASLPDAGLSDVGVADVGVIDDTGPAIDVGPVDAARIACTPGFVDGGVCDMPLQLAIGDSFSCVRPSSGRVWCWGVLQSIGRDGDTQGCTLRAGTDAACPTPAPLRAEDATGHVDETSDLNWIDAMDTGGCFAPQAGGTISCWGQSGAEAPLGRDIPEGEHARTVWESGSDLTNIDRFVVLESTAIAQDFSQGWHGWGANMGDVLGIGSGMRTYESRALPTAFADLREPNVVATGTYHACAITAGGGVACWGSNGDGESDPLHPSPSVGLTTVTGVTNAIELVMGRTHSCALTLTTGTYRLVCWGARAGLWLQSDPGGCPGGAPRCGPLAIPLGSLQIRHVWPVRNADDFCASDTLDHLWCWGAGYGTDGRTAPLAPVVGLPPIGSAVVEWTHSCAITTDSEVWCWGLNESGELGRGTIGPADIQPARPVVFP